MEQYVTYHKILDYFENYQQSSVGLNSFGHGDLVYFATTNSGTTVYPLMFVTPQLITYDENITTYQFSVIFGDIVNTDMTNQQDVITDMSIQAKRFISQFKRGTFIDEMDIQLPVVGTPFIERFNDHIGGVSLDCSITIFEDLNACDYYEPSPSPTPTPSVTPTNTPTVTPTLTPTPTSISCTGCTYGYVDNDGEVSNSFTYIDCDTLQTIEITLDAQQASSEFCYCNGSVVLTSVDMSLVELGSCP